MKIQIIIILIMLGLNACNDNNPSRVDINIPEGTKIVPEIEITFSKIFTMKSSGFYTNDFIKEFYMFKGKNIYITSDFNKFDSIIVKSQGELSQVQVSPDGKIFVTLSDVTGHARLWGYVSKNGLFQEIKSQYPPKITSWGKQYYYSLGGIDGYQVIMRSDDRGNTWSIILETSYEYPLCIGQSANDILYVGQIKEGNTILLKSDNNGSSWVQTKLPLEYKYSITGFIILKNGGYLIANQSIYRTNNDEKNWYKTLTGKNSYWDFKLYRANNNSIIALNINNSYNTELMGIYVSKNEGISWTYYKVNAPYDTYQYFLGLDGHIYFNAIENGITSIYRSDFCFGNTEP